MRDTPFANVGIHIQIHSPESDSSESELVVAYKIVHILKHRAVPPNFLGNACLHHDINLFRIRRGGTRNGKSTLKSTDHSAP